MCSRIGVYVGPKGTWPKIENGKELREFLAGGKIVMTVHGGVTTDEPGDNGCLCHVDATATAEANGYTCRNGWSEPIDWIDWIWERKTEEPRNG